MFLAEVTGFHRETEACVGYGERNLHGGGFPLPTQPRAEMLAGSSHSDA